MTKASKGPRDPVTAIGRPEGPQSVNRLSNAHGACTFDTPAALSDPHPPNSG